MPTVVHIQVHTLVDSADFERVLGAPTRARSPHFAVHHLPVAPRRRGRPSVSAQADATAAAGPLVPELSTVVAPRGGLAVDNSGPPAEGCWLGTVVPKRHARRSVSRTLIKRQMRSAVQRHAAGLAHGLWVLRLRQPFDLKTFPSAASEALREAVSSELDSVLRRAMR